MSVLPSIGVVQRAKSSNKVQATGEQAETVAEAFAARHPDRRAEVKAAVMLVIGASLARLKEATDAMTAADLVHGGEAGDDAAIRQALDDARLAVREILIELRALLVTFFGESVLASVGIEGSTPTDATTLSQQAKRVVNGLRTFRPPTPRRASYRFDNAEWIGLIEPLVPTLDAALEEAAIDERQNQLTRTAKNEAIAHYDRTFMEVANILEGIFIGAGRRDLADRVRPSTRKPGQTEEDAKSGSTSDDGSEAAA